MTAIKTAYFRNRLTGKVVQLPLGYAKESHPFYSQFEFLGDEYEDDKVVLEAVPEELSVPAGNASRDDWAKFAVDSGAEIPNLDSLGRDEIKAIFEENN